MTKFDTLFNYSINSEYDYANLYVSLHVMKHKHDYMDYCYFVIGCQTCASFIKMVLLIHFVNLMVSYLLITFMLI